jgi:hypothetical protein
MYEFLQFAAFNDDQGHTHLQTQVAFYTLLFAYYGDIRSRARLGDGGRTRDNVCARKKSLDMCSFYLHKSVR